MNPVIQSLYPVLAPVVVFLIIYALQKFLTKPDTLASKLEYFTDAMEKKFDEMRREKDKQIAELEEKLYKQEKESWDKMNGLRGDIIRIQTKLNGVGWGAERKRG